MIAGSAACAKCCKQRWHSIAKPRNSSILPKLLLALRTIMRAPTADNNLLDWSFTDQARLACTAVGAMLDLKEAGFTIGVHVICDGRSAGCNRRVQHFLQ